MRSVYSVVLTILKADRIFIGYWKAMCIELNISGDAMIKIMLRHAFDEHYLVTRSPSSIAMIETPLHP